VVGTGLAALLSSRQNQASQQELADTDAHSTSGEERPPFPNADDP
jgi:hypothetical protein